MLPFLLTYVVSLHQQFGAPALRQTYYIVQSQGLCWRKRSKETAVIIDRYEVTVRSGIEYNGRGGGGGGDAGGHGADVGQRDRRREEEEEAGGGGLTGGFFDHRGDHMNQTRSSRLAYHLYPPESKNTIAHQMVRISLALNAIALILSVSVIVVVVTLTMSLVTTTTRQLSRISQNEQQQQQQQQQYLRQGGNADSLSAGNMSMIRKSSHIVGLLLPEAPSSHLMSGGSPGAGRDGQNLVNSRYTESQAFGQILALSPLFIVTSLFGMSASQKFSSTGTIVCYWITLTFTLLISIYVTSGFIEYEELFNTRDKSTPIDAISRFIVLIGALQMTSAAIVTIAKYQKKRVAVKEASSFNDLNMRLDPDVMDAAGDPQVIQENLILIMASPAVEVRRRVNGSCLDANLHQQLLHLHHHQQPSSDQSTASSSIPSSSATSSPASSSRAPAVNLTASPFVQRSVSRPHDRDRHDQHEQNGTTSQRIVMFEELSPHHRQPLGMLHQPHGSRHPPLLPPHHQQRVMIRELIPAPSVTLIREKEEK